ncbi:MAG: peptidylprolyl isomerase [Candidatus Pacebacteria bacterium]|nr:peptidylprolyl isomerase [Candidatus Paceibacterota bacterium]MBP9842801.1 peptidylprolyl isomerase [Candidatus Paceibacterota bacterium]
MKRAFPVIAVLFLCGALIVAVSLWLGPEKENSLSSENGDDIELIKETPETLPAPLNAEELAAYDVDMTNNSNPVAVFTTNKGVIEIELFEDYMPITVGNFKKLAGEGFYNGIKFHRVIEGFMIQGGDPNTKTDNVMSYGQGGPGYTITDEFVKGDHLTNVRGTISMANTGQPNSGGSQFFINLVDNVGLDFDKPPVQSSHPVFGQIVKGMEVVDAIGRTETNANDLPVEPVVIEKVEVK